MSNAKLKSHRTINQIRNSIEPDTVLANRHKVHRKTIYNIRTGQRYTNIPQPKTLRNYPNYTVYGDGTVETRDGETLVSGNGALSKSIKLTTKDSRKVTVNVADLVKQAFG